MRRSLNTLRSFFPPFRSLSTGLQRVCIGNIEFRWSILFHYNSSTNEFKRVVTVLKESFAWLFFFLDRPRVASRGRRGAAYLLRMHRPRADSKWRSSLTAHINEHKSPCGVHFPRVVQRHVRRDNETSELPAPPHACSSVRSLIASRANRRRSIRGSILYSPTN